MLVPQECPIIEMSGNSSKGVKPVTIFYKYLRSLNEYNLNDLREKWTQELENPVFDSQWKDSIGDAIKISGNLKLHLIHQKILCKLYWTQCMFDKGLSKDSVIWWCSGTEATYIHTLAMCHNSTFLVINSIKSVTNQTFEFFDINILLNYLPSVWTLSDGQQRWILCTLPVAKCHIPKTWKDKFPPTDLHWTEDLQALSAFEYVSFRSQLSLEKCAEIWKPFLDIFT